MGKRKLIGSNPPNITNKQFQKLKRKLQGREYVNNDRLFLIPCSGGKGWYEMAENSALIYYNEIVVKNGLNFRFFADTKSLYDRYELGYIRIPNINDVRTWLKKAEMYDDEGELGGGMVYFDLKKPFSERQLERYRQMELQRRAEMLTVEPAHNLAPEFYQLILSVGPRILAVCNNRMDRTTCDTMGKDIVRLTIEVLEYYHHLTYYKPQETVRIREKWKAIRADLYNLLAKVKVMSDYRIIDYRTCIGITEVIDRLIEITELKLKSRKLTNTNEIKESEATIGISEEKPKSMEGSEGQGTSSQNDNKNPDTAS